MSGPRFKDLTGKRFGRLLVIERIGTKGGHALWKCKCDCGNEAEESSKFLNRGHTNSCGCLVKERMTTHGLSKTKLHNVWNSMKERCSNPNVKNYSSYGGRGITVCDEWSDFIPFYQWAMNNGYTDELTIDRVDNDGNYEVGNCKWSTYKEQANNKRNNFCCEYQGETKTISQWSEIIGISPSILLWRVRKGWGIEKALETPIRPPAQKINFTFFEQKRKEGKKISQACLEYGITKETYYHALAEKKKENNK